MLQWVTQNSPGLSPPDSCKYTGSSATSLFCFHGCWAHLTDTENKYVLVCLPRETCRPDARSEKTVGPPHSQASSKERQAGSTALGVSEGLLVPQRSLFHVGSGLDSGGALRQVRQEEFGGRLWRLEFSLRTAYSSGALVPLCQLREARFQNIHFC